MQVLGSTPLHWKNRTKFLGINKQLKKASSRDWANGPVRKVFATHAYELKCEDALWPARWLSS